MADKLCLVTGKEPFGYTLSIFSGKWKLNIIYVLACLETVRYSVLKKNVDGITHKMLSSQLKELEADGIVARHEYPEIPPRVEYTLTDKGRSLIPLVASMCRWGEEHRGC